MEQQSIVRRVHGGVVPYSELSEFKRQVKAPEADIYLRFGRFCLFPRARQLLADGRPVDLGSRAFDLLMALIEVPGALVKMDAIMNRVWPDVIVEESNLRVQMSALRRVLGEDRDAIKTIPGRGYVFVGEVAVESAEQEFAAYHGRALEPLHRSNSRDKLSPFEPPLEALNNNSSPTVVVIDDDRDVREALLGLFRSVGLKVELFASIQQFLGSARQDVPGCLVLDVRLPGRSGLDFQDDLIRAKVRLPVIFITGYADVPMSVRAMKAGAVEFLTKPVRPQELLDAVQLAIERDLSVRKT